MNNDRAYSVVLKNSKKKSYTRLGLAIVIMNVITFLLFLFFDNTLKAGIIGLTGVSLYFLIKKWESQKNPTADFIDESVFFLLASVWLMQSILIASLLFITGLLFKVSLQPFKFIFTIDYVQKDFFPGKKYEWESIESVVLKAGILTINFKNDHLIQGYIEKYEDIDEKSFNDFVMAVLNSKIENGREGNGSIKSESALNQN